jgi:DNA-binding transcriptional LysR family regulator
VFESDENTTVHGLVAAGAGVAITPKLAVNPNDERVVAVELSPRVPPRVIAIAWHRDRYRSAAADAFVELAQELCVELDQAPDATLAAAV